MRRRGSGPQSVVMEMADLVSHFCQLMTSLIWARSSTGSTLRRECSKSDECAPVSGSWTVVAGWSLRTDAISTVARSKEPVQQQLRPTVLRYAALPRLGEF